MRRRRRVAQVDTERLASVDPADWLDPAERARLVELIDEARGLWEVDDRARTVLDRVAPGARYPARLLDRDRGVVLTERMVVSYRRSLAGWRYAVAAGLDGAQVADKFGLGHVSRPDDEDAYWLATHRIE